MAEGVVVGDAVRDEGRQERVIALLRTIVAYEDEVDNIDRLLCNLADKEVSIAEFLAAAREMYELETQSSRVAGE